MDETVVSEAAELAELIGHAERAARTVGCEASAVEVLARRPGRVVTRVRGPGDRGSSDVVVTVAAEPGAFAAEAAASAVLRGAGVPVNHLLRHEVGPPGVLVARWVEGPSVTAGSPAAVLGEVGRVLAAVHALPARPPCSGNPTLVAWIDGWVRCALAWWAGCPGTTAERVRVAERWWAGVRLIDVADLQSGDPVMDLAVLELHEPGVLRGVVPAWGHAEVGPSVRSPPRSGTCG